MSNDWPDNTVGCFDEDGNVWCKQHEPTTCSGELTPVLDSDGWVAGPCKERDCLNWVGRDE